MDQPPENWSVIWELFTGTAFVTAAGALLYRFRSQVGSAFRFCYRVAEMHVYRERTLVSQALYIRYLEGEIKRTSRRMAQTADLAEESLHDSSGDSPAIPPATSTPVDHPGTPT